MEQRDIALSARRGIAIAVLSGLTLNAAGYSTFDANPTLKDGPGTDVTIPEDGATNIEQFFVEQCKAEDRFYGVPEKSLTPSQIDSAVEATEYKTGRDLSILLPGDVITIPVAVCDRVHTTE